MQCYYLFNKKQTKIQKTLSIPLLHMHIYMHIYIYAYASLLAFDLHRSGHPTKFTSRSDHVILR